MYASQIGQGVHQNRPLIHLHTPTIPFNSTHPSTHAISSKISKNQKKTRVRFVNLCIYLAPPPKIFRFFIKGPPQSIFWGSVLYFFFFFKEKMKNILTNCDLACSQTEKYNNNSELILFPSIFNAKTRFSIFDNAPTKGCKYIYIYIY